MFLISNFLRMRFASFLSARISSRSSAMPAASSGSSDSKRAAASGSDVSIKVPLAVMKVMSLTVWYESNRVPHRIPPELFATTPPTVAMSVEAGSGPSFR